MESNVIIDMFRLHWNSSRDFYDCQRKYFDNYERFAIKYVFGGITCNTEYCNRKDIKQTAGAIFNKFRKLHVRCAEKQPTSLEIGFDSFEAGLKISVWYKNVFISVTIEPEKI